MKRNVPKVISMLFMFAAWSYVRELYSTIFYTNRPDYLLYDALGAGYLFFAFQVPYLIVAGLCLWLMLKPKTMAVWYFFGQLYLALLMFILYFAVAINNLELAQETFLLFLQARGRDVTPEAVAIFMSPPVMKIFFVIYFAFLLTLGALFFLNSGYYLSKSQPATLVETLQQYYDRGIYFVPVIDGSQQILTKVETQFEFSLFFDTYYLQPRPELVGQAIIALGPAGVLKDGDSGPPVAGFFSEVFAANPGRVAGWRRLLEGQDHNIKSTLRYALALSQNGGVLSVNGHSCQLNDMYWGAFFASGNTRYVKKLINQVKFIDERDDIRLFMTGATAKWSLASVARTHDRVRSTLEAAQASTNRRGQELITQILTQDPGLIQQEWREIVAKQREAGKWR